MSRTVSASGMSAPAPSGPAPGGSGSPSGSPTGGPGSGDNENSFVGRTIDIRELAMMASFNTSSDMIAAADTGISGVEQRRGLTTDAPFTLWGQGSYTSADNNFNKTDDDRRYNGDVWGYNIGADYRFNDDTYAGLSIGYSETDMTTSYNTGKYEETNWTVAPYLMHHLNDDIFLAFIAGYSFGEMKRKRTNSTVSGSADTDSWFVSAYGEYDLSADESPFTFLAKLGYMYAEKRIESYTESDDTRVGTMISTTSQIKPGLEAGYDFLAGTTTLTPFVKTDFVYDFADEINDDSSALNAGLGLRINGNNGLSGVIEGEQMFLREKYSEYTIKGLLAYNFDISSGDAEVGSLAPYMRSDFADDGQVFGSGLKFTPTVGDWNVSLDATHSLNANSAGNTGAKLSAEWDF